MVPDRQSSPVVAMITPAELAARLASSTVLAQSGEPFVSLDLQLFAVIGVLGTVSIAIAWVLNSGSGAS